MTQTVQLPIAVDTDLYVGGKYVSAGDAGRFDVLDPSTGQPLASVADGTVEDALAAVAAAHEAGPRWAAVPPRERAEILRAAFEAMNAKAEGLAELISLENGKALRDARGEVAYAAEFFRWYSEEAVRNLGSVTTTSSSMRAAENPSLAGQ